MKKWIITLIIGGVLGFGIDLLLKNSHTDFFPGYIKYKTHTSVTYEGETIQLNCSEIVGNGVGEESKTLSLLSIRQQKEMPNDCIEDMGLTIVGTLLYLVCILIIPLLIGFMIAKKMTNKKN